MNEIVYINQAVGTPKNIDDHGKWKIEDVEITKRPTKCKVTINKSIVIDDVYVSAKNDTYSLFKDFNFEKFGYCNEKWENCWIVFRGVNLVLEFRSDDFVIEHSI